MRPFPPKIIKSTRFEDGSYAISAPVHPLPIPVSSLDGDEPLDPAREAAEAETRQVFLRAHEEAQQIIDDAREQAERLVEQLRMEAQAEREVLAESARLEGLAKGLAEGRVAGRREIEDEFATALGNLQTASMDAAHERARWFEDQQKDLVKLALLIAQKILVVELATSREAIVKMAETAIQHVTDKTSVRLRAHPLDVPRLTAARSQLLLATDNMTTFDIVGDATVGLGGCMIDTRTGMVDARLSTQLSEIAAKLLDVEPGPDGASDMDPTVALAIRALGHGVPQLAPKPVQQAFVPAAPAPAAPAPAPAPVPAPPGAPPIQAAQAANLAAALQADADAVIAAAMQEVPVAPMSFFEQPEPEAPAVFEEPVLEREVPVAPAPAPVAASAPAPEEAAPSEVPAADEAPATVARQVDPSRRAADALAARLGKLKRGRGVITLSEEYDLAKIEGALTDQALEQIVRQTTSGLVQTDIGTDQVLVHNPFALDQAADALAERLGKKPRKGRDLDGALEAALDDSKIAEIMGTILPQIKADPDAAPLDPTKAPDVDKASEALAKLLGQKKRKSNRPWYEQ